jgi:hypothetical protein
MKSRIAWLGLIKSFSLIALVSVLTGCMSAVAIEPMNIGIIDRHLKPEMTIKVKVERDRSEGFQCFEPYLWVATIGIVPIQCINTYRATALNKIGEEQQFETYRVTSWSGWVAYLIAAFPGWNLDASYGGTPAFVEGFLKKQYEAQ